MVIEKLILIIYTVAFVDANGALLKLGHLLKKRSPSDMIDFSPTCSSVFKTIDTKCLTNFYTFYEAYNATEKIASTQWESQCRDNIYDCVSSPDPKMKEIMQFYEVLLPRVKALCADGCMLPLINIIHSCFKQEMLDSFEISRSEMEDLFDLTCIQEGPQENGKEGEYCIIKAMTTATYLFEANKIHYCNLDSIDLSSCDGKVDNEKCTCNSNCSTLITTANALMGCCMGSLLQIEKRLNMTHPDTTDLMNPGNKLFTLCGVKPGDPCKTSKQVIAKQEEQYRMCYDALMTNSKTQCIALEEDVHDTYIAEMQRIDKTCKQYKNLGQCQDPTSKVEVSQDLKAVLTRLNNHCSECGAELAGIRENCTVLLPNEAKMIFQMMCLRNSDLEHCGPKIIEYEAEMERQDLNSNPCFKGYMSTFQHQCSEECSAEVAMMNKYNVLNCFDALVEFISSPEAEWQVWHKNCIKTPEVEVTNKISIITTMNQKAYDETNSKKASNSTFKIVALTFVATVGVAILLTGLLALVYKRQTVMNMFGYNKFHDGQDNLISDVHMEDTIGEEYDDERGENYYD